MNFSSLVFVYFFLPVFLACYFIFRKRRVRNTVLLLFSAAFYAWGEPVWFILILASAYLNMLIASVAERKGSKALFTAGIAADLALLAFFKYAGRIPGLAGITVPLGLSFYVFQAVSYLTDVKRGTVPAERDFISFGVYLFSFPQLIQGPIVRYGQVMEDLTGRKETTEAFANGLRRFILGLGRKVLIANGAAAVSERLLSTGAGSYGALGAMIAVIAYTVEIYFDFAGYTDMAIGLGMMTGFTYPENFDHPYCAVSVTDFWRRWHITLSSFFRDYVYIPLGGSRQGNAVTVRNLLIVWALTGIWHGTGINFLLWGLYYGILLTLEKFVLKDFLEKLPKWSRHLITIVLTMFGWMLFMSGTPAALRETASALFGAYGPGDIGMMANTQVFTVRYMLPLILGIRFSAPLSGGTKAFIDERPVLKNVIYILIFCLSTWIMLVDSYSPFVYFKF